MVQQLITTNSTSAEKQPKAK